MELCSQGGDASWQPRLEQYVGHNFQCFQTGADGGCALQAGWGFPKSPQRELVVPCGQHTARLHMRNLLHESMADFDRQFGRSAFQVPVHDFLWKDVVLRAAIGSEELEAQLVWSCLSEDIRIEVHRLIQEHQATYDNICQQYKKNVQCNSEATLRRGARAAHRAAACFKRFPR